MKKKIAFVIKSLPYNRETSRLGLTHAIASQSVDVYLDEGDMIEPVVCFIGDGVLNCLKDQQCMKHYNNTSMETHIKNALLVDLQVYICKEDIERFGLTKDDIVTDAQEIGADKIAEIVPFDKIQGIMEEVDHLQFF
ncbi:MAG: DsrE family protein [Thermodesulfovibrionales bacterium]|nr:DsrE family protein [Thermodesulfovibrionales bacterium]